MAVDNIRQLQHNSGQKITYDDVFNRMSTLENDMIKSLTMALHGSATTCAFYGLDVYWDTGLDVKVAKGAMTQYVDETEMLVAVNGADSSAITLSTAHSTLNRIDIIEAKIQRVDANQQTVSIWNSTTHVGDPTLKYIDYEVEITFQKKDGTAGSGVAPSTTAGWIKIAEIFVPAGATEIDNTLIYTVYEQDAWSITEPILIDKSITSIYERLAQLRIDFDNYKQDFQGFTVNRNTTKSSTLFPLSQNPFKDNSFPDYTDKNPFDINFDEDGRVRYGYEQITPQQFWLDEYSFYRCEDERIRMEGNWQRDENGFYWTEKSGDAIYITFKGIGLLAYLKSNDSTTNSLQIKVDNSAPSSFDLEYSVTNENDFSLVKVASGLVDEMHTVRLSLNENLKMALKGFIIVNPVTSDEVIVNKGSHMVLDSLIPVNEDYKYAIPTFVGYGRRDIVFIDKEDNEIEVGSGTSVGSTSLYGSSVNHTNEEISYRQNILNYYDTISDLDLFSGISTTTEFDYADDEKTYIEGSAGTNTELEFRFFGTGLDIDMEVSTGNATIYVDGVSQGTVTLTAGKRSLVKVCSSLKYGSHIVKVNGFTTSATVKLWQSIIYRPKTALNNYEEKYAIACLNMLGSEHFKAFHLDKVALLNGVLWTTATNVNNVGNLVISNANTAASQTLEGYFVGTRVRLFGNKGDYGIFDIRINTTDFTGIDCYAGADAYDTELWDSDGLITLSYGVHYFRITTTNSKNASSASNLLQFSYIDAQLPLLFTDYEHNPFDSATEISRKEGIEQTFIEQETNLNEEHEWNQKEHNNLQSQIETINDALLSFYRQKTYADKFSFIGIPKYNSSNKIDILPKYFNGNGFIGGVTNEGKFIFKLATGDFDTDKIQIDYSSAWGSLDGIGTVQNNEFYAIIGYDSDGNGTLAFDLWNVPQTILSTAISSATTVIPINQTVDKGLMFSENSHIALWQDSSNFETIYGKPTDFTYIDNTRVSSRVATQLTLAENTKGTSYNTSTVIYQLDNFQPLDYSTGSLNTKIKDNGWFDTGWRVKIDGSGNIIQFLITDEKFYYVNGSGSADFSGITGYDVLSSGSGTFKLTYVPPDKHGLFINWIIYVAGGGSLYSKPYYVTYYEGLFGQNDDGGVMTQNMKDLHGIVQYRRTSANINVYITTRGYIR